jgi:hypothetical protein
MIENNVRDGITTVNFQRGTTNCADGSPQTMSANNIENAERRRPRHRPLEVVA